MGAKVNIGVRPEDFVETQGETFIYEGEVDITEALGEVTLLYFTKGKSGQSMIAKLPGVHAGLRHRKVRLGAEPSKIHVFLNRRSLLYRGRPTTDTRSPDAAVAVH